MKILLGIFLTSLLFTLSSCERGNLYLDNTGNTLIKVQLDGQTHALEPKSGILLDAKKGVHRVILQDENQKVLRDTIFTMTAKGGLLNLAKGRYMTWKELYGDPNLRPLHLQNDTLEYGTWVFYGDFTQLDSTQLFYPKNWDYDLDQIFPVDRVGWDPPGTQKYIVESKIYRVEDFVDEIKKKNNK